MRTKIVRLIVRQQKLQDDMHALIEETPNAPVRYRMREAYYHIDRVVGHLREAKDASK